ncbi:MAG: hypothetical protein WC269_04855, partial [Candidatus Gracilibacteria bacterium]
PKTSTDDYLKSLKGAAGTLPSVDTNKVEAAKSVLKNGTGEGADEGAKHTFVGSDFKHVLSEAKAAHEAWLDLQTKIASAENSNSNVG